jgi:hypothetical protein
VNYDLERVLARGEHTQAHLELIRKLRLLSSDAGLSHEAADDAYFEVLNAIDRLMHEGLRARSLKQKARKAEATRSKPEPSPDFVVRQVRMSARRLGIGWPRCSEEQAIRLVVMDFPPLDDPRYVRWKESDLRPAERRAMQMILDGTPPKAKKNPIELDAMRIVDAVEAEWSARRASGRPKGRKTLVHQKSDDAFRPAAVRDVINSVTPPILQLAGARASSLPSSMTIETVVAAVKAAGLQCTVDRAANDVRKLLREAT